MLIPGTGAERRSHKKRLEKYYEHVAESLKSVTSSDPECMPETLTGKVVRVNTWYL